MRLAVASEDVPAVREFLDGEWRAYLSDELPAWSEEAIDLDSDEATCPACGFRFDPKEGVCPDCGLRFG